MTSSSGSNAAAVAGDERLQELLVLTSRTFALAIPLLPQPTCREVTLAYLLFRIADTFEDASLFWPRTRQIGALDDFCRLLEEPVAETRERALVGDWLREPPTDHPGYLELLREVPEVLGSFRELPPGARDVILVHTLRTARLMAGFVARSDPDGVLRLRDVPDLRGYCYAVAGIVGEVCTELFLLGRQHLQPVAGLLRERAASFGEGLQLVNILKDSASDAREGRYYLPPVVERAEILALARDDLRQATEYVLAVQRAGGPDGIVLFTGLPVALARATLDAVETRGPGAKLSRPEVFRIQDRLKRAVRRGEPALAP